MKGLVMPIALNYRIAIGTSTSDRAATFTAVHGGSPR